MAEWISGKIQTVGITLDCLDCWHGSVGATQYPCRKGRWGCCMCEFPSESALRVTYLSSYEYGSLVYVKETCKARKPVPARSNREKTICVINCLLFIQINLSLFPNATLHLALLRFLIPCRRRTYRLQLFFFPSATPLQLLRRVCRLIVHIQLLALDRVVTVLFFDDFDLGL